MLWPMAFRWLGWKKGVASKNWCLEGRCSKCKCSWIFRKIMFFLNVFFAMKCLVWLVFIKRRRMYFPCSVSTTWSFLEDHGLLTDFFFAILVWFWSSFKKKVFQTTWQEVNATNIKLYWSQQTTTKISQHYHLILFSQQICPWAF